MTNKNVLNDFARGHSKHTRGHIQLMDQIASKTDRTVKYVFKLQDDLITEIAYIDKDDGKDILCVSSQTGCKLGCLFCHTTDARDKIITRNLTKKEMFEIVEYIYNLRELKDRMLLVSYMGCGEPLLNWKNVCESMRLIQQKHSKSRFAIATMMPDYSWFEFCKLIYDTKLYRIPLKVHLSLHFTNSSVRKKWMPAAMDIGASLAALEFYHRRTDNSVEIHYALISGLNDGEESARDLVSLLQNRDIPVKLLRYNKRDVLQAEPSESDKVTRFMEILEDAGIFCEYYEPPGTDVGASCGQFLLDHYLKYNAKDHSR